MSEAKFTDGPWVACISSNDDGDICTAIKDKGNGNCIVVNEIDEDYECLLLAVPELYAEIERDIARINRNMRFKTENDTMLPILIKERDRKIDLLAKARGEK